MNNAQRVRRPSPKLVETEIDGDISLYHPPTEQVTVLNGTASDVWRLCDGDLTVEEIAELLATAYGVDSATIAEQVEDAIRQFEKANLLEEE